MPISSKEDCESLKRSSCSDILNLAQAKHLDCPKEVNVLYMEADKVSSEKSQDEFIVPTTIVKNMICDVNGIVREGTMATFDSELKRKSTHYCKKHKGYTCSIQVILPGSTEEVDSKEFTIVKRDGAETECLKEARKLIKPHCKDNTKLVTTAHLKKIDGDVLKGTLMSETYSNLCKHHRRKKVFH